MAYITHLHGRRTIHFGTTDFLLEAIDEFLESGANPIKFASCIIKIATAVELLLKEKLENLCPALVLDTIDDEALQVAKIFGLSRKLLNPHDLDRISIKTAPFPKLLRRASRFFDLDGSRDDLARLHKIRNGLIHHSEEIDTAEVNLLLINKIFPFLERFTKQHSLSAFRLSQEKWRQLKNLAELSADMIATDVSKMLAHHADAAKKLSAHRIDVLIAEQPEMKKDEQIIDTNLVCPACKNASLTAFFGWDLDFDDAGPVAGSHYTTMRCRVCGLHLDQNEIQTVIDSFHKFFGKDHQEQKAAWENAIDESDYFDNY